MYEKYYEGCILLVVCGDEEEDYYALTDALSSNK